MLVVMASVEGKKEGRKEGVELHVLVELTDERRRSSSLE